MDLRKLLSEESILDDNLKRVYTKSEISVVEKLPKIFSPPHSQDFLRKSGEESATDLPKKSVHLSSITITSENAKKTSIVSVATLQQKRSLEVSLPTIFVEGSKEAKTQSATSFKDLEALKDIKDASAHSFKETRFKEQSTETLMSDFFSDEDLDKIDEEKEFALEDVEEVTTTTTSADDVTKYLEKLKKEQEIETEREEAEEAEAEAESEAKDAETEEEEEAEAEAEAETEEAEAKGEEAVSSTNVTKESSKSSTASISLAELVTAPVEEESEEFDSVDETETEQSLDTQAAGIGDVSPSMTSFAITGDFNKPRIHELRFDDYSFGGPQSFAGFSTSTAATSESGSARAGYDDIEIDRYLYCELYRSYKKQNRIQLLKNNYLNIKMGEYYIKRKLFHFLYGGHTHVEDIENRYQKLLETLERTTEYIANEKAMVIQDEENRKRQHTSRKRQAEELFLFLQNEERTIAQEIINSAPYGSAKAYAERVVNRLLNQQKDQHLVMNDARLLLILLRNKVQVKQDAMDEIDRKFSSKLRLMDYEQMKVDNRNLRDKLEDYKLTLMHLRDTCKNRMMSLAHMREKVIALDHNIYHGQDTLESVSEELAWVRAQLQKIHSDKNELRAGIRQMKEDQGLLSKPLLLRDMEKAVKEIDEGNKKLEELQDSFKLTVKQLDGARRQILSLAAQRQLAKALPLK